MRLGWIVALAVGVLLLAVGSVSIYGVTRLRDDRDKARSELVDARQSLGIQVAQLNAATELRDVYERVSAHRGRTIRGLEKQVNFDRAHLIDCWTALVRIVPAERMASIFGQPTRLPRTAGKAWRPVRQLRSLVCANRGLASSRDSFLMSP
jgi:hypothetical protein